jgi:DNA-binding transcriptional LysR family regulator
MRDELRVPRFAVMTVLADKVGEFSRKYPDIVLDITTDDSRSDLVAGGFDAGILVALACAEDPWRKEASVAPQGKPLR